MRIVSDRVKCEHGVLVLALPSLPRGTLGKSRNLSSSSVPSAWLQMDPDHPGPQSCLTFMLEPSAPNAQTPKAPRRLCICRKLFLAAVLTRGPSLPAGGKEFSVVENGKFYIFYK